jgi:hypothetical protein
LSPASHPLKKERIGAIRNRNKIIILHLNIFNVLFWRESDCRLERAMAKITIEHGYIFQASPTGTLFRKKGIQGRESQIFSA